jgi:hypothetical protein
VSVACYLLQHPTQASAAVLAGQWQVATVVASGGLDDVRSITQDSQFLTGRFLSCSREYLCSSPRNTSVERARVYTWAFERYETRWDLLRVDELDVPVFSPLAISAYGRRVPYHQTRRANPRAPTAQSRRAATVRRPSRRP